MSSDTNMSIWQSFDMSFDPVGYLVPHLLDIWYAICWSFDTHLGIPCSIKAGRFGQSIIILRLLFHILLLLLPRLHYHTTPTHLEVSLPLKPHSGARPSRRLSSPWLYLRDIVLSDFDHQSGFYDEYIATALLIGLYFGLYSLNLNKALYVLFSVLEKGR